jgi:hypothetical protein
MKSNNKESLLVTASAVLWLVMVGLAALGHWLAALYTLLPILLIYAVLGSSHKGQFDLGLVAFPTLIWIVLWAAAFGLGNHYAEAFAGQHPDFAVLGFHPSFASIIVLFWIVPTLLMGFGFELVKDRWLSREKWDHFVDSINELSKEIDDHKDVE